MQFKFAYNFNESFVFQKILVKTNYIWKILIKPFFQLNARSCLNKFCRMA